MNVSFVTGVCVNHDAISNAVRDEIRWMSETGKFNVKLFAYACDHANINVQLVQGPADVLLDPHFQSSGLIIYHFGIYFPLFDTVIMPPAGAKRLAIFHNITPKDLLPEKDHAIIDKSFTQLSNLAFVDHVACDSQTNLEVLREAGIKTSARVLSLAVHSKLTAPEAKPSFNDDVLRIAFIGRFVRSKGPTELVAAIRNVLKCHPTQAIRVDMIGNVNFSDAGVLEELHKSIAELNAAYPKTVHLQILGNATDQQKMRVLEEADLFVLPTYHEGFCVPIIEALSSGCRIITYNNSNTPAISGGLADLVPTGDVNALSDAINRAIDDVNSLGWRKTGYQRHCANSRYYVSKFSSFSTSRRFLSCVSDLLGTPI
jgi:glycosyltransferase involved in cell wall biosynthesis